MSMPDDIAKKMPEGLDERPPDGACEDCGTTLEPVQSFRGGWFPPEERCEPCQRQRLVREHEERRQANTRESYPQIWDRAQVPQVIEDDLSKEFNWPAAAGAARDMLLSTPPTGGSFPCAVYLYGEYGSGKSTFAGKVLAAYLRRWRRHSDERREEYGDDYRAEWASCDARYANPTEFLARKQASFDIDESFDMSALREAGFLVIDDIGREPATGWKKSEMYQLINYRCSHKLPTLFTANAPIHDLEAYNRREGDNNFSNYDGAATGRIAQMCGSRTERLWEVELQGNHRIGGTS